MKLADSKGDMELRKQIVVDCFYACKVIAILVHPIAPEGFEMFRDYMKIREELWNWDHILKPISFYVGNLTEYKPRLLEPRVDFYFP